MPTIQSTYSTITAAGAWTNVAASSVLVANAVWDTTAAIGGFAIIRLK